MCHLSVRGAKNLDKVYEDFVHFEKKHGTICKSPILMH